MVWNAAGTFHTRLSATALTANRKFVFPDLDGTFVVASAGHLESLNRLTIRQDVFTGSTGFALVKLGIANGTEAGWTLNPNSSDLVVIYPYIASTLGRSRIWAINPIVDVSATATVWGEEININMGWGNAADPHTTNHAIGLDIVSGGIFAPSVAIATNATTAANRWKHGIWFDFIGGQVGSTVIKANSNISADYGIDLSSATFRLQHLRLGSTPAAQTAVAAIRQVSNGEVVLFLQLATDAVPVGNIIQVTNAANNIVIMAVDASGNIFTKGGITTETTLTVSGTAVVGNLTVPGKISASACNVINTLSCGQIATTTWFAPDTFIFSASPGAVAVGLELYPGRTIDGPTFIDFHATSATDFDFRIIRQAGISGDAELINVGGGKIVLSSSAVQISGILSVSSTASFLGSILIGGTTGAAPYDNNGSIAAPTAAGAKFRNTCKAWVEFTIAAGTPTLNTQFNVSGVTRASSGVYAVNLTNASLATSFPFLAVTISGTAGTIVRAGGLTSTQSFGITTTVGNVATDASAVAAGAWDQ